ncbi:MAG TPA: CehA/McbA family metallohydrolase [Pyrinomonadaceae bacterium]|nr:CehA/McbA family metallohydrolase [Pyrinomonadaceae bacterium]
MRWFVMISALLALISVGTDAGAQSVKWYKGNTHTHTNNSDGDSSPDEVVKWYRSNGYNFVVITDHEYITPVDSLNSMFGKENVFVVFSGQEVTDRVNNLPYHINGLGLSEVVIPAKAGDPVESLQKNIDAVSKAGGLPQLNHPNFGWALSADEIRKLKGIYLMEIANAHPLVNNHGGGGRPSVESIWDELLTAGMVIYGIANDDSHTFKRPGDRSAALPGQAWIYVRSTELTATAIFAAMRNGDFYSSTGVELDDVSSTESTFTVDIKEAKGRRYRTEFIGSGGRVLAETGSDPAVYQIRGGEGYVRARVRDSNGLIAWTQPIFIPKKQ